MVEKEKLSGTTVMYAEETENKKEINPSNSYSIYEMNRKCFKQKEMNNNYNIINKNN